MSRKGQRVRSFALRATTVWWGNLQTLVNKHVWLLPTNLPVQMGNRQECPMGRCSLVCITQMAKE
jgi:hypothetical protein